MTPSAGPLEFVTVSADELNCELVSYCLQRSFPQANFVCKKSIPFHKETAPRRRSFCLIDCMTLDAAAIEARLNLNRDQSNPTDAPPLILFNVEPHLNLKTIVKRYKIRGLFLRTDPPDIFCKGIRTIFAGELWLSRKMLSECILMPRSNPRDGETVNALSKREKAILNMIAQGASNQDIADALTISIHTVKTHISHIYKKFNVTNRIQASLILTQTAE